MGPAEDRANLLSMVGDLTGEFGGEWRWIEDSGKTRVEVFRLKAEATRSASPLFSRHLAVPAAHWLVSILRVDIE
jgi:hypothetical protein